jgi:hypothetical protein
MKPRVQIAQQILKAANLYTGKIDGDAGPKTKRALAKYPGLSTALSLPRQIIACIQLACKNVGIDAGPIDGYWGPTTANALEEFLYYKETNHLPPSWRPEEREVGNPHNWPKAYTPEFEHFYGPLGDSPLVRISFPYPMKIAWNPSQKATSTRCHKMVADSANKVFKEVLKHYGQERISELRLDYFGGCYNKRAIRGGTKWSVHSWGIAFDFDPSKNQLKWGRDRASFANPEYDAWWQIWESEGWISLGRERNFDWMHVQAARI